EPRVGSLAPSLGRTRRRGAHGPLGNALLWPVDRSDLRRVLVRSRRRPRARGRGARVGGKEGVAPDDLFAGPAAGPSRPRPVVPRPLPRGAAGPRHPWGRPRGGLGPGGPPRRGAR